MQRYDTAASNTLTSPTALDVALARPVFHNGRTEYLDPFWVFVVAAMFHLLSVVVLPIEPYTSANKSMCGWRSPEINSASPTRHTAHTDASLSVHVADSAPNPRRSQRECAAYLHTINYRSSIFADSVAWLSLSPAHHRTRMASFGSSQAYDTFSFSESISYACYYSQTRD